MKISNDHLGSACTMIDTADLAHVRGGLTYPPGDGRVGRSSPISPETVGCAIGGAAGAQVAGPWGGAGGCIVGGAVANQVAAAIQRDNAGKKPEQRPYNPYAGGSGGVFGNL
jgi:hypothetical protein